MKTLRISSATQTTIQLGRRGENEATEIVFDCSALETLYGTGTAMLYAKRPTETTAYPVTISQDGSTVTWTVTNVDTAYRGRGECELFWYVGDVLAKSVVWPTQIAKDISDTSGEVPDPIETWLEQVGEILSGIQSGIADVQDELAVVRENLAKTLVIEEGD